MTEQQLVASTYIVISERSSGIPVLYATSGIHQGSLFQPEEIVGYSPLDLLVNDQDAEQLRESYEADIDENVIRTSMFFKSKNGIPLFAQTITFVCGNINFNVTQTYPNIALDPNRSSISIQRFKYNLSEDRQRAESGNVSNESVASTARASNQACLVMRNPDPSDLDRESGPKIVFATDSISRILDINSCDLQGVPFLSLIAREDSERAKGYLERLMCSSEYVFENLKLLVDPLDGNRSSGPRSVAVEFMGMGSDDGVIMLCQPGRPSNGRHDDNSGYVSLEDIVSSDPATSDFPDQWDRVAR